MKHKSVDTTVQEMIDILKEHDPKARLYIFSDTPESRWVINNVYPHNKSLNSSERYVEIEIIKYKHTK